MIFQIIWVIKICGNPDFIETFKAADKLSKSSTTIGSYKTTLIVKVVLIFVVYILAFVAMSTVYFLLLNKYAHEMESFHLFLTTYR